MTRTNYNNYRNAISMIITKSRKVFYEILKYWESCFFNLMAIVKSDSKVKHQPINRCKTYYVQAIGTAIARDKSSTKASREAKKEAKAKRDNAVREAKRLRCPEFGGCPTRCKDRGLRQTGVGLNRIGAPKWIKANKVWEVKWIAHRNYDLECVCRGHIIREGRRG